MPTPVPAGLRLGHINPTEAVAAFAARKLLKPSFAWQDVFGQEHMRGFAVAGVAKLDVLTIFQTALAKSLDAGGSMNDFANEVMPQLVDKGFWGDVQVTDPATGEQRMTRFDRSRLELIYDVNMRQSFAAGRWQQIERVKDSQPFVMYRTMQDERVRASHKPWDGVTLPVDDPFWDTHYPPCGYRCRCTAFGVSAKAMAKFEAVGVPVKTEAPPIQWAQFVNKRTGEIVPTPRGIDPGFGYNPGKTHLSAPAKLLGQAIGQAPQAVAVQAVRSGLQAPLFSQFLADAGGPASGMSWPVAVLPREAAGQWVVRPTVMLTGQAAAAQVAASAGVGAADYLWVQRALEEGASALQSANVRVYLLETQGWVVLMRVQREGTGLTLQTFRRLTAAQAQGDAEVAQAQALVARG